MECMNATLDLEGDLRSSRHEFGEHGPRMERVPSAGAKSDCELKTVKVTISQMEPRSRDDVFINQGS